MGCILPNRTFLAELVSDIIDEIRERADISSIIDNGDGTALINTTKTGTVDVDGAYTPYITIDGDDYQVIAVAPNVSFTIRFTGALPSGSEWVSASPYFYYGNPIQMSNEIDKKANNDNVKYPAIIMFESGNSSQPFGETSPIETIESLELYFMDVANYEDWAIDDFYSKVINKMYQLSIDFTNACEVFPHVDLLTGSGTRQRISKWGVEVVRNGAGSGDMIFNDNLSGIQLLFDLPISKSLNNECC